ncbi:bifunctional diaminohydroxyphosphoribosylaminopyrimidine deaminase/5-amino-6-(5-phosphoribosylamino)uracil reductase RibD [Pedobacter sp. KR3-3]|uniref:Riboflavin biosynthesis protein RibD n=1 Tax=Pedobacter albus TaxID=3113905 RepID=A0ABU7I4G9_9SPHI|nr:bifunctional diaminohydroxyphosphoribosylaminopyrimidine deaminase/5-amino-6-(5-phosphoribosylamino)uracil reductase RibD [Pedobacter sp. KR3-3]MEE1944287.1 bifunctional diaminohydroxyphosphoribosylaminopyrimidine deaminase/5-amino-6-(5-phosphoribosylamino)uracil reductase RibD [Pedobacter sp. KR3-3]
MNDEFYMQRCLELAILGMGQVSPNPMVGCVIVHENQIIGEGYHQKFGEAHAEVNAINEVFSRHADKAPLLLKNATAYVSLEPCAHFGKTPPCADLLVKHQLKKVVIGSPDPFAGVNGKGIEKLKAGGVQVQIGVLEAQCNQLNRRFLTRIKAQRPFIILKWAQTANGYFAPENGGQTWISGPLANQLNHVWRTEEDAILVGKQTALNDNPRLTARNVSGKNPVRILIDRNLEVPSSHHLYDTEAKTIIFNEVKTDVQDHIHFVQMEDMSFYLAQKIAFQLYLMDIQSVIVEGGAQILKHFIDASLWDEARIFTSQTTWPNGILAPAITGTLVSETAMGTDVLKIYTPL